MLYTCTVMSHLRLGGDGPHALFHTILLPLILMLSSFLSQTGPARRLARWWNELPWILERLVSSRQTSLDLMGCHIADPTPAWRRVSRDIKLRAARAAEQQVVAVNHDSGVVYRKAVRVRQKLMLAVLESLSSCCGAVFKRDTVRVI